MSEIGFGILAFLTLGGALVAVGSGNLFRATLGLMLSLVGVAGLFLIQEAEFLAAVQILIYVGGIAVLIIFSVVLLERSGDPLAVRLNSLVAPAIVTGAVIAGGVVVAVARSGLVTSPPAGVTARDLGTAFLNQLLVPFEAVSVLLLAALIGAILIAREKEKR